MIRRPPRSTQSRSSAASDVYKRQVKSIYKKEKPKDWMLYNSDDENVSKTGNWASIEAVSYTHLRAHETPEHLVCRLLLEKTNIFQ